MSEGRSGKAGGVMWMLLTLGVPLLYLLSVPPITIKARIMRGTRGEPDWVTAYGKPCQWVRDNTVLGKPFDRYEDVCWEWLIPK